MEQTEETEKAAASTMFEGMTDQERKVIAEVIRRNDYATMFTDGYIFAELAEVNEMNYFAYQPQAVEELTKAMTKLPSREAESISKFIKSLGSINVTLYRIAENTKEFEDINLFLCGLNKITS